LAAHGYVVEQKFAINASDDEVPGSAWPALSRKSPGEKGMMPVLKHP
jgi:hypothetical protein